MRRPLLLDLFSGAGGAAMGYHRAGFDVVGVDVVEQPRYPFAFVQGDALRFLAAYGEDFDAIHASPPCQHYSTIGKQTALRLDKQYPDLVEPTRQAMEEIGLPYVIENVMGSPLRGAIKLCGSSFGLDLRRHRLFEAGGWEPLLVPPCAHGWQLPRFRTLDKRRNKPVAVVGVYGRGAHVKYLEEPPAEVLATVVGVHGHLNYNGEKQLRERAMGIDWMKPYELSQAIPPAYTEWMGAQLLANLR